MARVVVYGATGFTGRLTVAALVELGVGEIVLCGRDAAKLAELSQRHGGLEQRAADARAPAELEAAFAGAQVVIDTAGPFSEIGEPVLRAALAAGAHFLDTSGEQPYLRQMQEQLSATARDRRLAVVNGHAFEFALGCCAGALAADSAGLTRVDLFYRVAARGLSQGTKRSIARVLGAPQLVEHRAGRLQPMGWLHGDRALVALAIPGGEALQLPRTHPALISTRTHLVGSVASLLPLAFGWCSRPLLRALERMGLFAPLADRFLGSSEGPLEAARRTQRFQILAQASGDAGVRRLLVSGTDAYGTTAAIVALGAERLLQGPPLAVGVVSTDQAFGARAFLEALRPYGVNLSE
jgi:short subunit dehydrogenase-like uncharacterized protein